MVSAPYTAINVRGVVLEVLTVVFLKDQVLLDVMLMGVLVVFGIFWAFIIMLGLTLKMQALQSFEMSGATSS
jgi:hypothetical protein